MEEWMNRVCRRRIMPIHNGSFWWLLKRLKISCRCDIFSVTQAGEFYVQSLLLVSLLPDLFETYNINVCPLLIKPQQFRPKKMGNDFFKFESLIIKCVLPHSQMTQPLTPPWPFISAAEALSGVLISHISPMLKLNGGFSLVGLCKNRCFLSHLGLQSYR